MVMFSVTPVCVSVCLECTCESLELESSFPVGR